eukprot:TRINITY_DN123_c0_g3_i2.p1 TRINITY_DN123_c0_g3~~TRINITY_DN123_c0_g3_i2.p1  ORF type:complete len:196 (-),score=51.11 TRINITY_DN123_c0_g3_i2:121-708(-)
MEEVENNEVYQWLKKIGMTEYFENFKEVGCSLMSDFKYFETEEQMVSLLSISRFFHKRRLWDNIQRVQQQSSENDNSIALPTTSLPSTPNNTELVVEQNKELTALEESQRECCTLKMELSNKDDELVRLKNENAEYKKTMGKIKQVLKGQYDVQEESSDDDSSDDDCTDETSDEDCSEETSDDDCSEDDSDDCSV